MLFMTSLNLPDTGDLDHFQPVHFQLWSNKTELTPINQRELRITNQYILHHLIDI